MISFDMCSSLVDSRIVCRVLFQAGGLRIFVAQAANSLEN